jgi:cell fate regulator YaaT (PSP1 superfamily)
MTAKNPTPVEICFKRERKKYFHLQPDLPLYLGDYAIVEVDRGLDMGRISFKGALLDRKNPEYEEKKVVRKATPEDFQQLKANRDEEKTIRLDCQEKIKSHNLPMKLIDVEKQFDGSRITFFFFSEQRVDFRALVKDLAAKYKARIEMRQLGVREEARHLCGVGICGFPLCCTTCIKHFEPITTQMAREQNLAINQSKLCGACGRLKCCLRYELTFYQERMREFPQEGEIRVLPDGKVQVISSNVFKELVRVKYENGFEKIMTLEDINLSTPPPAKNTAAPS